LSFVIFYLFVQVCVPHSRTGLLDLAYNSANMNQPVNTSKYDGRVQVTVRTIFLWEATTQT
jgi:hypothetical protein